MTDLRELLADGRVHVADGAMGTAIYARGVFVNVCYDELNLSQPDLIADIHEQYIRAGAEIIETNTFGANPVKLSAYGLEERTEEINRIAAEIATKTAGGRVISVGAIGPLGVRLEPWGHTSRGEAKAFYEAQAKGLLAGGVQGFVLETFSDLAELEQAFQAIRGLSDLPVIAQLTIGDDCSTSYGTSVEQAAQSTTEWEVDALGLNCSVGPAVILDGLERMAQVTNLPLTAQPNAGLPRSVGDRKMYLAGPEYMAQYARRMIEAGARIVGGCCGTTPDHIRLIHEAVASLQPQTPAVRIVRDPLSPPALAEEVPFADRSRLGRKLAQREFVTSVEVLPPHGWDPADLIASCRTLALAGIDVVNISENRRMARMAVLAAAKIVAQECSIEPIVHYRCRDRTMFDMISDLLGAAAGSISNLMIVDGEPPIGSPYPDRSDIDIDSIGLTNVITGLNRGVDPGGNPIGAPTQFVTGVALNQGARDSVLERERLFWKADAGANFAVTQPVFDAEHLLEFLAGVPDLNLPILAGLWPLQSLRQAEFLQNEVPGMFVPDLVVERMRGAQEQGRDEARREGLAIATETASALADHVQGFEVAAAGSGVPAALTLLDTIQKVREG